jgi:CubicO group peptidase (beta-lactamase class C family)
MPLHLRITALVTGALLFATPSVAQDAAVTDSIRRLVESEMRAMRAPGAAVAVVRDNRIILEAGFGVASSETREPVTPATLFRIGSTTKMVSAAAALALEHEGRLRLADPIGGYARGLAPALQAPSLHLLLSHRAGFWQEAAANGAHDDAALSARVRGWTGDRLVGPLDDVYSYSGPGYWLAGYAIEQAAGASFADAVAQRVLRPAGMVRSTFRPLEAMTWPIAQDHRVDSTGARVVRPFPDDITTWASGSLFSSAREMARFMIALLNDGMVDSARALPAGVAGRMMTAQAATPDAQCGYGYGLSVCRNGSVRVVSHAGFRGGSGSIVMMVPEERIGIVIITNRNGGIMGRAAARGIELLLGRALAAGDGAAPQPAMPAALFPGTYVNGIDTIRVTTVGSALRFTFGVRGQPARVVAPNVLELLGPNGRPEQRFMLLRGRSGEHLYLHDGLAAFQKRR